MATKYNRPIPPKESLDYDLLVRHNNRITKKMQALEQENRELREKVAELEQTKQTLGEALRRLQSSGAGSNSMPRVTSTQGPQQWPPRSAKRARSPEPVGLKATSASRSSQAKK